jgi:hypothetical protein
MTKERFNEHVSNRTLGEKVFNLAKAGYWPVGLNKELILARDEEFGDVRAVEEIEIDDGGLYTTVRSSGVIECVTTRRDE